MRGGLIVKEARLRAGLTQKVLADRLGVTQAAVGRWESGAAAPSFDAVVRAVRACGLELTVGLATYDDQDDVSVAYHRAMSPSQRLSALRQMLELERGAARSRKVDATA